MATSNLSKEDDKFIQDLLDDKASFFFKERSGRKNTRKRRHNTSRRRRGFGIGFAASTAFFGFYIRARGYEHRFGYSRKA
tara:strand:+ start:317 stop:556 length:240 start_codon:yes stop_codon:yes gene_type:complete